MTAMTTPDLWAIYYPGKTPEQAYYEASERQEQWFALYQAQQTVAATHKDCETRDDEAAYRSRLAAAQTQLLLHDGVPAEWIDEQGRDVTPAGVCRECRKPGATDIDRCDGCEYRYHPACHLAVQVRCDLRCAAWALIQGDTERAAMWERSALAKHEERVEVPSHAAGRTV